MSDSKISSSYHRSWVDDCPSGILSDCFVDRKKQRVLTQTQAAYESYNQMLGLDEGNNKNGDKEQTETTDENFINYQERNTIPLFLILLLLLIAFLYLRR